MEWILSITLIPFAVIFFFWGKHIVQLKLIRAALWGIFERDLKEDIIRIQDSFDTTTFDDYDSRLNEAIEPLQDKLKKLIDEKIPKPYDSIEVRNLLDRYLWDEFMHGITMKEAKKKRLNMKSL